MGGALQEGQGEIGGAVGKGRRTVCCMYCGASKMSGLVHPQNVLLQNVSLPNIVLHKRDIL
jgi:hypothetical protein